MAELMPIETTQPYYLSPFQHIEVGKGEEALIVWGDSPYGTLFLPGDKLMNATWELTWTRFEWKAKRRNQKPLLTKKPFGQRMVIVIQSLPILKGMRNR